MRQANPSRKADLPPFSNWTSNLVSFSLVGLGLFAVLIGPVSWAEETKASAANDNSATAQGASVPRLVQFGGVLKDQAGQPLTGVQGVTFALYQEQLGGAALWLETQNVTADEQGHFTALLGATQPSGLPLDLFTSGQAHFLGVQAAGLEEQPRIYLASVPYALATANTDGAEAKLTSTSYTKQTASPGANASPATGDITGVIAGNGLAGGGLEGDVTLRVIPCSSGQILKWTGGPNGSWTCQRDEVNIGTITGITVGPGLSGGGTLGGVEININNSIIPQVNAANTFTSPQSVITGGATQQAAADSTTPARTVTKAAASKAAISDNPPQSEFNASGTAAFTGEAGPLSSNTIGVLGLGDKPDDIGVFGNATAISGQTAGVFGQSKSPLGYGGAFQNTDPAGKSLTALDSSGADVFDVFANGKVGIGQPAPGFKLDVGGQINATGGLCINTDCKTTWPTPLGTVTQVNTGPGLAGGPITTTGTVSIADLGVTNSMLANSAITVPVGQGLTGGGTGTLGGSVPTISIDTGGVDSSKILDGTIADADISNSAAISPSKIAGGGATLGANSFTDAQNVTVNIGGGPAIRGTNSNSSGTGVTGLATATSGQTFGVFGQTSSTTNFSNGVLGIANGATGATAGVAGFTTSSSNNATGVLGQATQTSGQSYGVVGGTSSTTNNAAGVFGQANAGSGQLRGVWGQTNSTSDLANGVRGEATGASGQTRGVFGSTSSTTNNAAGVFGSANGGSGAVRGVQGVTNSITNGAAGVQGNANGASGGTRGVAGFTNSTTDFAVGVQGTASMGSGRTFGVAGFTNSTTDFAAGVQGNALGATGNIWGVHGTSNSTGSGATGVRGSAYGATGETYGVRGDTNSTTDNAAGVSGEAHGTTGWIFGVEGETESSTEYSAGVLGVSSASGPTVGVLGVSASSSSTAGVFVDFSNGAGKILSGRTGTLDVNGSPVLPFPEVFRVEGDGDVVANVGDFQALGAGKGIILKSPNGATCARISLDDNGVLATTAMACP